MRNKDIASTRIALGYDMWFWIVLAHICTPVHTERTFLATENSAWKTPSKEEIYANIFLCVHLAMQNRLVFRLPKSLHDNFHLRSHLVMGHIMATYWPDVPL